MSNEFTEDAEITPDSIMEHLVGGEEVEKLEPIQQKHLDDLPPLVKDVPSKKDRTQRQTPMMKWLGTAESVAVHKRIQNGKRELIGNYRKDELEACADFENFLVNYVVPTHGPGTYEPTYIDKAGKTLRYPDVTIAAPMVQNTSTGALTSRDILDLQAKAKAEALADEDRIAKKAIALGGSSDALVNLLARQQEATNQMLLRQFEEGSKPMPLPIPPPQQDVGALMTAMMAPIMTMMQAMMAQAQSQAQMQMEMFKASVAPKGDDEKWQRQLADERDRAREERERAREQRLEEKERAREDREREREFYRVQMETVKAQTSTDPLERALAVLDTTERLKERFGGDSNSIADVLGSVAEKLPDILREANKGRTPPPAPPAAQVVAAPPKTAEAAEEDDEETPAAVPLEVPAGLDLPLQRLKTAGALPEEKQVEERIRTTIQIFQILYAAGGDWAASVNQLLIAVQMNNDKDAQGWVEAILAKIVEGGKLDVTVAKETYQSIVDNWNAAMDMIRRAAV